MHNRGVLADLIPELGVHSHDHAIGRLDALERLAESRFHVGHTARGQNLEGEARLLGLTDHLVHARRGVHQVEFADRVFATQQLAALLFRAGAVVDTAHVEIYVPPLLLHHRNDFRFVGADSYHYARVPRLLAPLPRLVHLAVLEETVGVFAVMIDRGRLERFVRRVAWIAGALADYIHLAALQLESLLFVDRRAAGCQRAGVDAESGAPVQNLDRPFRGVVLGHQVVKNRDVVRHPMERVVSDHEAAHVHRAELYSRDLHFGYGGGGGGGRAGSAAAASGLSSASLPAASGRDR